MKNAEENNPNDILLINPVVGVHSNQELASNFFEQVLTFSFSKSFYSPHFCGLPLSSQVLHFRIEKMMLGIIVQKYC